MPIIPANGASSIAGWIESVSYGPAESQACLKLALSCPWLQKPAECFISSCWRLEPATLPHNIYTTWSGKKHDLQIVGPFGVPEFRRFRLKTSDLHGLSPPTRRTFWGRFQCYFGTWTEYLVQFQFAVWLGMWGWNRLNPVIFEQVWDPQFFFKSS